MTPPRWCAMTLSSRKLVHDLGEHEARQRHAGLVRPAEHAADFVFGIFFRRVIGHVAGARRMQQDRLAGFGDDLEDRPELRLVERHAVGIGGELHRIGAVRQRALGFLGGGFRRIHRQQRRPADEMLRVFRHDFAEAVIGDLRHLRRFVRPPQPLHRRQAVGEHLRIILERFDDAQPQLEIGQSRDAAHALAEILRSRRRLQQRVVIALREKVIEGVDIAHAAHSPYSSVLLIGCQCACISHDAMAKASASRSK